LIVQEFAIIGSHISHDAFDKFVEKNESSLSLFQLYLADYEEEPDKYYEVMRPFLKSAVYTEICVNSAASVDTFLERLRNC